MSFGEQVLKGLGFDAADVAETLTDVRRRDAERLELQVVGGITAGHALLRGNLTTPEPAPLTRPQRETRALNDGAAEVIEREGAPGR
jgi:glutathione-regulated potassium-efflux system protein KefB